jgi:hypothetical protein
MLKQGVVILAEVMIELLFRSPSPHGAFRVPSCQGANLHGKESLVAERIPWQLRVSVNIPPLAMMLTGRAGSRDRDEVR